MLRLLLAAGRAVTSRVPWLGGLAHRYGPICLGVVAKLQGRCRVGGGVFTTRERFITLAAAGEMLKDTYEINERWALVKFATGALRIGLSARLAKTALQKGLLLMTHWNVAVVAPPLTVTLTPVVASAPPLVGAELLEKVTSVRDRVSVPEKERT